MKKKKTGLNIVTNHETITQTHESHFLDYISLTKLSLTKCENLL